jgi:hypothetical protein
VLDAVVITFLVPIAAWHIAAMVDERRQTARDKRNYITGTQITEALPIRHDTLKASTIIDANVG